MNRTWIALALATLTGLSACATQAGALRIRLGEDTSSKRDLARVRSLFESNNPGYSLDYAASVRRLDATSAPRIAFVQRVPRDDTKAVARVADATSELSVGDLVLLRPGVSLDVSAAVDVLVFGVPDALDDSLPTFLRPDWNPGITDTPGGCATETGAYRRVVLTWLRRNGKFNYRALNAHRVRITDSFTHYHPKQGGFDEFYLVQMVQPGARLLTSTRTTDIVAEDVSKEELDTLFESTELRVGDLVYIPRGVVHRGLGGVLAHVITTPGFIPGAEIGVDHHLAAINAKLGLRGDAALPLHAEGAKRAIVRE